MDDKIEISGTGEGAPDLETLRKAKTQLDQQEYETARRKYEEAKKYKRLFLARSAELWFYFGVVAVYLTKIFLENRDLSWLSILTNSGVIVALVSLFFVIFVQILTGNTPLVAFAQSLQENVLRINKVSSISVGGLNVSFSTDAKSSSAPIDEIKTLFVEYMQRSTDAMDSAKRRPNALILAGTVIAFVGLVFFILTLPGSRYGFLDVTPQGTKSTGDFWGSAIELLPRLLMLLFIQVLAGFFLRQYRSSMEEFRYYEAVLRHREAQYLSYLIRDKMNNKGAIMHFADDLMKERAFGTLAHGHTTTALEAQRAESNEFLSLYERLAAFIPRKDGEGGASKGKDDSKRKKGKASIEGAVEK
jgi:hypothetical protein